MSTHSDPDKQANIFGSHCTDAKKLFKEKNAQYGNAFESYGVLGVVCEILGAVHRLPQLVLWQPDHGRSRKELIREILQDIHNFSVMAIMVLDKDNWDGRKDNGT